MHAYLRLSDNVVVTWVNEPPPGWLPPEGYAVVDKPKLPAGWIDGTQTKMVPAEVTPRQLRLALIAAGIMPDQVSASIAAISDVQSRASASTEWEYALSYRRDHPLIAQLAASFGLTTEQVDALFTTAAAL